MSGWQNEPYEVEVRAGESKAFCMCGRTATPPFCDGSHVETDKMPHVEKFEFDQTLYICGCRCSEVLPYCDGAHLHCGDKG